MAVIGIALILAILIQLIMFIPAFGYKTDKLTDLSYALTFVILASLLLIFNTFAPGKLLLLGMITLWAVRLGSYLYRRIRVMGRDARFDAIREDFFRFLGFWLLQGVTVWIIMIPSALYFSLQSPKLHWLSIIGMLLWLKGLIIESVADQQKFVFKNNPVNANKWLDSGLWAYSRHPNYFGEILCWLGIYLFAVASLSGYAIVISLISPVFITLLLLYYSGVPSLEKSAEIRFGHDSRYKAYKKNTSILFLWPPKDTKFNLRKKFNTTQKSGKQFILFVKKITSTIAHKTVKAIHHLRSKHKHKQEERKAQRKEQKKSSKTKLRITKHISVRKPKKTQAVVASPKVKKINKKKTAQKTSSKKIVKKTTKPLLKKITNKVSIKKQVQKKQPKKQPKKQSTKQATKKKQSVKPKFSLVKTKKRAQHKKRR